MLYVAFFETHGLKMLWSPSRAEAWRRFTSNAAGTPPAWMTRVTARHASTVYRLGKLGWHGTRDRLQDALAAEDRATA